jgi:GAF domain-containing protein
MSHPQNESLRLKELHEMEILDTESETIYDNIVEMASLICDTPVALLSFIDSDRQWVKAKKGLNVTEVPRDLSFCSHVILEDNPLIVPDALQDERFCHNPFVAKTSGIRFYVGIPVRSASGSVLGALCVIDYLPKRLTNAQLALLKNLGQQATDLLENRRKQIQQSKEVQSITRKLCHEINNPLSIVLLSNTALKRKLEKNPELAGEMRRLNQAIDGADRIGQIVTGLKKSSLFEFQYT